MNLSKEECTLIMWALEKLHDRIAMSYWPRINDQAKDISDIEAIKELQKKIARGK